MGRADRLQAWAVDKPGPVSTHPLAAVERPVPEPAAHQLLVRVEACGVCRTDLHLAEGDLPPKRHLVVPGHEVVGVVEAAGESTSRGTASVSPGWEAPAAAAGFAPPGGRTSAWHPRSRAGTWTGATRPTQWPTSATCTGWRPPCRRPAPPRCCAPGSSVTGPGSGPASAPGAVSGSTASGGRPT